jgi:phosphatidylserine decarboxylase
MNPLPYAPPERGWVLREGYPFVAPLLALAVAGFVAGWTGLGWLGIVLALAVALFFRNPTRKPLRAAGMALAPADGRVAEISRVADYEGRPGPFTKVSVFMSVFNVHVNRAPVNGEVVEVRHQPGEFRPADRNETSRRNERNMVRMRMEDGRELICVQVAGILARRIVCWVRAGATMAMGSPFGMIRFGSRVDTYLPEGFDPDVRPGQRVWGGETVLGYFPDSPPTTNMEQRSTKNG